MPVIKQENAEYGEYVNQLAVDMGVFDLQGMVWHYTDGGGFLGILQSGTMFATQVSALNDAKETQYGTDLFKEATETVIAEKSEDFQSVEFLETVLELVKEEPTNPTQGISKFFVTCFSSAKDDLNQWSKYQKASAGRYAIGFHPAGLNREPNSTLYRVVYDRRKVKESSGMGVKPKQATESFSTSNVAARRTWRSGQGREEKKIIFALMVSFEMMMIDIFGECPPQRSFPKQNEFGQAFLLNRAHPSLSESVQVRAARQRVPALCVRPVG